MHFCYADFKWFCSYFRGGNDTVGEVMRSKEVIGPKAKEEGREYTV